MGTYTDKIKQECDWLNKLADGLETLDGHEFKYDQWVSKMEDVPVLGIDGLATGKTEVCGTTCCAFGWMPRFVPEAGVEWKLIQHTVSKKPDDVFIAINNSLFENTINKSTSYTAGDALIGFVFYGRYYINGIYNNRLAKIIGDPDVGDPEKWKTKFGSGYYMANLQQVINRIRAVIKFIEVSDKAHPTSNSSVYKADVDPSAL